MKYKVTISKFFEEEIEAVNQEEAEFIAWEDWSQNNEVEFYCYEIENNKERN